MTLYLIGLGLNDEKDISVKGLETVKKCDFVYLETYTSKLNCSTESLEKLYGKKIVLADRDLVEKKAEAILNNAKAKDVAFLVIGDVFSATTHIDLVLRARKERINIKIIHNASILTAIGITGLELYKFGKVSSIPFDNENIKSPIHVLKNNQRLGLHTMFLLDLDTANNKYLSVNQAAKYLIKNKIDKEVLAIACARLGSEEPIIKVKPLKELKKINISEFPQCLVIPGKLHFMEEDALNSWR